MTLEEAIKHCEEKAEELEEAAWENRLQFETLETISKCEECAKEHRQLAEWLKELKAWRKYDEHRRMGYEEVNADECKTES